MLHIPAGKAFRKDLLQLGVGQLGERILDDQEANVRMLCGGEIASLPQEARVFVMPVLYADLPKACPGQARQHLMDRFDQSGRAQRQGPGKRLSSTAESARHGAKMN